MIVTSNGTYRGFVLIYDKNGIVKVHKDNATCCQAIRDYKTTDIDRIVFGFPNDWLPNEFRNEEFLKFWCSIVSKWFTEVKYIGKGNATDLKTNCDRVNSENGYYGSLGAATYQGVPINKGDLITNN